ncbi:hypothetical protein [Enterococcus sp. AZ072]|uniref:hypothetical protein n=1 Tax=unclassified Enterococcus TaxID=2608891 RepID=UPI003D2D970A
MKKRVIIHSVSLWMGACIFLYSNYALAATSIYDPMNPNETITPIPNDSSQEVQESTAEIVYESTDSSEATETSESSDIESSTKTTSEAQSGESTNNSDENVENNAPKEKKQQKKAEKKQQSNKIWNFIRHPQTSLMLDDDFFSNSPLSMPEPVSGGEANEDNEFSQVALSAYLLSGVALYGESVPAGEKKLSDYFA